jgi:oligosaccharyltransferase complex subunit beta
MSLTPYENNQVFAILRGSEYTYSLGYDESLETEILNTGSKIVLAAGMQGRNNARAVITGSLDMFSNELYGKSNGVNRKYASHLIKWNFGQSGVLKVNKVFHHFAGDSSHQPGEYKVLDDLVYNTDITTWDASRKEWVPYVANDLYLEFVMLDPYIRMPLTNVPGTSIYRAEFKVPDKYGVFQFKVQYKKPGFTFIQESTKITIRPFKHNEYERFLFEAFPYYFTVFGTLAGFCVFVVFFLLDAPKPKRD